MQSYKPSIGLTVVLVFLSTGLLLTSTTAAGQEKVLHSFSGADGAQPWAGLVFDSSGNLYGTTRVGGAYGFGTVFELSPAKVGGWYGRALYSFSRMAPRPGIYPMSTLVLDGAGNLYGTASEGGNGGWGTAFELKHWPSGGWGIKVLARLGANDGRPEAGLVFGPTGNLYGTGQVGTAFQLMPQSDGTWTTTVIHTFVRHGDGGGPIASLILDDSGNLYGTTPSGGAHSYGTVLELSPELDGSFSETILHSFQFNNGDGFVPRARVIRDGSGNLYGTTFMGGQYRTNVSGGTVFELSPAGDGSWTETLLYNFGSGTDGSEPEAGLAFDAGGNLYGTTRSGGAFGGGTVFKLTPGVGGVWTETIVHSFGKGTDGNGPVGDLIFDAAGNLYGTTYGGGKNGNGTVFEITP